MLKRSALYLFALVSFSMPVHAQEGPVSAMMPVPSAPPAAISPTAPTPAADAPAVDVVPAADAPAPEGAQVALPNDASQTGAASFEAETNVSSLPPSPEDFIPATEEITPIEKAMLDQIDFLNPGVNIATMPSLFFSVWEHDLLVDARRGLNTRPPADDDQVEATVATGPRDVALSGIVYASASDWVIWLNNMRISPGRIPNEIMDLKVYKNHIDLEWFDASTNQIFPIRLRPHQRFNLDARIFLPGNI